MKYLPLIALALVACHNDPPRSAPPARDSGVTCDATEVQGVIGKSGSPELADAARRQAGAATARFLAPGAITTMEYRGDRLNLRTDAADKVIRVSCG